mgnify:CR=1 FL=1
MHSPEKILCAKRIEEDNNEEHMPFSSLFDQPALNKGNIIWEEHYKRILKTSKSLKNILSILLLLLIISMI